MKRWRKLERGRGERVREGLKRVRLIGAWVKEMVDGWTRNESERERGRDARPNENVKWEKAREGGVRFVSLSSALSALSLSQRLRSWHFPMSCLRKWSFSLFSVAYIFFWFVVWSFWIGNNLSQASWSVSSKIVKPSFDSIAKMCHALGPCTFKKWFVYLDVLGKCKQYLNLKVNSAGV